jgi:hypothetical protein
MDNATLRPLHPWERERSTLHGVCLSPVAGLDGRGKSRPPPPNVNKFSRSISKICLILNYENVNHSTKNEYSYLF